MTPSLTATALSGIPLVQPGDNLVPIIHNALARSSIMLQDGDVLVITSKIVSKSEGCLVDLCTVTPTPEAVTLAEQTGKDPRLVTLILQESQQVSRQRMGVIITQHRLGFVSANSGIDHSNTGSGDEVVLLLPQNPDASAEKLRVAFAPVAQIGVIISDTHGRPFRLGNVGIAIGAAGLPAVQDLRGNVDLFGRELRVSTQGYADMVASAAHLLSGEGAEGLPVVHIRGLDYKPPYGTATDLNRPAEEDLYL